MIKCVYLSCTFNLGSVTIFNSVNTIINSLQLYKFIKMEKMPLWDFTEVLPLSILLLLGGSLILVWGPWEVSVWAASYA